MEVKCLSDRMQVFLSNKHIFAEFDVNEVQDVESRAWPGTCPVTHAVTVVNGSYTVDVPFDACDTVVDQSEGVITFSNYVTGRADDLLVGGLVLKPVLRLPVQCSYSDSHISSTNITSIDHKYIDPSEGSDNVLASFQINAYTDAQFSQPATYQNPISVGERIFFQINSTSMPSNVRFVVETCTVKKR